MARAYFITLLLAGGSSLLLIGLLGSAKFGQRRAERPRLYSVVSDFAVTTISLSSKAHTIWYYAYKDHRI